MRKGLMGARSWCAIALVSGVAFGAAPRPHTRPRRRRPGRCCRPTASGRRGWPTDGKSVWNETRASASAEWRDPERLLSIRGTVGKLVFSPDSKQLAFENPRGDHAFIAVYDLKTNKIGYADPSFGTDSAPVVVGRRHAALVRAQLRRVAGQPVTAPVPSFGPWSPPPVRTNDVFKVADILQAPISYGPEAVRRRPLDRLHHARGDRPRDLLHALRHAVAPRRQLPRRRRPRALAARRLARRRRDRLRARQLAEQRRRDPQPGLGRRHAAPAGLRRRRRAPACRGCSATGWRRRSRRTTARSSGSTARA